MLSGIASLTDFFLQGFLLKAESRLQWQLRFNALLFCSKYLL